jgi:hypothetical protein
VTNAAAEKVKQRIFKVSSLTNEATTYNQLDIGKNYVLISLSLSLYIYIYIYIYIYTETEREREINI